MLPNNRSQLTRLVASCVNEVFAFGWRRRGVRGNRFNLLHLCHDATRPTAVETRVGG